MVTAQGQERMQQLVTRVQETGPYPSTNAESTTERALAAWLRRRREDARVGTLAPAFRDGLAVLPGWEGRRPAAADEHRCLAAHPRYRDRRGEPDPQKAQALDDVVPEWRTGRTRGRQSRPDS
jgi:hypothetical protein